MADPVGLISLIYDLSKDGYHYYQVAKERDNDIAELRAQLLRLCEKSLLVKTVIERDGLRLEDQHSVKQALEECEQDAQTIKNALAEFSSKRSTSGKGVMKLKSFLGVASRKARFPFEKPKIVALSENVGVCHEAVDETIRLLHLKVSVRTIEELRALDKRAMLSIITFETVTKEFKRDIETAIGRLSEQLAIQEAKEGVDRLLDKLYDADFRKRQSKIADSHDKTYDFFNSGAQDYPQAANLLRFLERGTGIFWISGEAASGKSTLMKYLSYPKRTHGRDVWVWVGDEEITIVRHFCWIADNDSQKSLSALLRSLLHYIISKERGLASLARNYESTEGEIFDAWRTADLWAWLLETVQRSKRRMCFFIDGLDELEESFDMGGSHEDIVASLINFSRLANVKLIVSSRPWKAFRALELGRDNVLRMETVNHRAILDYCQLILSHKDAFTDVVWDCLYESHRRCQHDHGDGHDLVQQLVEKSFGNFLWITLATNNVLDWLKAKIPLMHMRQRIRSMPSRLTDYLRDSMVMRVSDTWDDQKPMALKMSVFTLSWIPFWTLRNSDLVQLSQAEYDVSLRCAEYTLEEIRTMMQETIPFLEECCRDILDLQALASCAEMSDEDFARKWYQPEISFKHRTIFDFLKIPDAKTRDLIFKNLPGFFNNENFNAGLDIVHWSVKPARPSSLHLADLIRVAICWDEMRNTISNNDGKGIIPREPAAKAEQSWLHQVNTIFVHSKRDRKSVNLASYTMTLCYAFATHNLHDLIDTLLENLSELLCFQDASLSIPRQMLRERQNSLFTHFKLLKKVLGAGADPNDHVPGGKRNSWTTSWCSLLAKLGAMATKASTSSGDSFDAGKFEPDPQYLVRDASCGTTFSSHIPTVVKLLLRFGVELELELFESCESCESLHHWPNNPSPS